MPTTSIVDGAKLAELRRLSGQSQVQLAERSLVSREAIERIEQGATKRPHAKTVSKLAAALGCETADLWIDAPEPPPTADSTPPPAEPPRERSQRTPIRRASAILGGALVALLLLAVVAIRSLRPAPSSPSPVSSIERTPVSASSPRSLLPASSGRPALVPLEPGRFLMGNPESGKDYHAFERAHPVEISSFLVGRTEVTQGQYADVMEMRTYDRPSAKFPGMCALAGIGNDLPVVCVTWIEAVEFCNRLSEREGLTVAYIARDEDVIWNPTSDGYRLLTEAEWEYAARAGSTTTWVGTDRAEDACAHANLFDLAYADQFRAKTTLFSFPCNDGHATLAKVDREGARANDFGILGMGGNAAEWVWDFSAEYTGAARDPQGPSRGSQRVVRGASFMHMRQVAHVSARLAEAPGSYSPLVGFRIARSRPRSDPAPR